VRPGTRSDATRPGGSAAGPGTPRARPARSAIWAPAWELAARGLLRWWLRSVLLVLLIGLAVTSYLTTSVFATGTRARTVPDVDLGMDRTVLARLTCIDGMGQPGVSWAYVQLRWLDDPRVYEYPRSELRYRSLVTGEEDGELAMLRAHPDVAAALVARLLTLEFPWGTDDFLSLPSDAPVLSALEFVAGRPPAGPAEVALPRELADLTGLLPGSEIEVLVSDPDSATRGAHSASTLTVTGVFSGGPAYAARRPLGWIEGSYDIPWITNTAAHWPRTLERLEPNSYLIELRPEADMEDFLLWFTDEEWTEGMYLHLHERYPVAHLWCDYRAAESLALGVTGGMSAFAGILLLSLAFVAVGVFTIFILAFLERRREIAILKTVGLTGVNIATVFWTEAGAVAFLGLLVGTAGAAVVLNVWFGAGLSLSMVARAAVVTGLVIVASCLLPVAMARVATVSELLGGQRVTAVFRHRVGALEPGALARNASRPTRAR